MIARSRGFVSVRLGHRGSAIAGGQSFVAEAGRRCRAAPTTPVALPAAARGAQAGRLQTGAAPAPRWCRWRHRARARGTVAPFDLGTLGGVFPKQLGLDVQETLDIARPLYETQQGDDVSALGFGYLPESMLAEVPDRPRQPAQDRSQLCVAADRPPGSPTRAAWNDGQGDAHHGIIHPDAGTRQPVGDEREGTAVYRLIRAHYVARSSCRTMSSTDDGAAHVRRSVAGGGQADRRPAGAEVLATPGRDADDGD